MIAILPLKDMSLCMRTKFRRHGCNMTENVYLQKNEGPSTLHSIPTFYSRANQTSFLVTFSKFSHYIILL